MCEGVPDKYAVLINTSYLNISATIRHTEAVK